MLIVGRERELQMLRTLVAAAEAGAGGAALVEGDAGLGKTRLLEQIAAETASRVVWGRAWEEPGAPPYWPWRQALDSLGHVVDWDEIGPAPVAATLVLDALRTSASERPVVVLLDDLHATDDDSRRMAAFVARSIGDLPVALLVAARPSADLHAIARASIPLRLAPLDGSAADELIVATSSLPLSADQRGSIAATAEGNPLVTIELARLAGTTGRLPRELRMIVHERIAPLNTEQRALLDHAAVLGRTFSIARLVAMDSATTPRDALVLLEPAAALDVVTAVDHSSWRFTHQILRDVIYDELESVERRELHARAAAAITATDARSLGELAHHLSEAVPLVDRSEALAATLEAAERARAAGASGDAADTYARALELTDGDTERLDVLLALGRAAIDAGEVGRAHATFDEAITLSRTVDAPEGFAAATLGRTERLRSDTFSQRWLPALEAARRGLGAGSSALGCRLLARKALILGESGGGNGLEAAERAVADARRVGDPSLLAECLVVLHFTCCVPESVSRAVAIADELVRVAEQCGDPDRMLEGTLAQLTTQLTLGDMAAADDALARCETLAASTGNLRHRFFALSRRAMRLFLAGQVAEGDDLLRQAYDLGIRIEEPDTEAVFHGARMVLLRDLMEPPEMLLEVESAVGDRADPLVDFYVSYVSVMLGDPDVARDALENALTYFDVPQMLEQIGWPYWACRLAEVVVAVEDRERAELLYDALAPIGHLVAINAGAVAFGGVIDHYVGLLCDLLGRPAEAVERLERARSQYRAMGAVRFVGQVERELDRIGRAGPTAPRDTPEELTMEPAAEGWRLTLGDHVVVVSDSRGLQHLARLRGAPGQKVHVLDLTAGQPGTSGLESSSRQLVLDDAAKAAYRERVAELQGDIAEADGNHDIERAALLRADLDALLDQLREAAGLGGRSREIPTDAERARIAVRKAIVNAIDRVAQQDPRLGQHLRDHVRTGVLCSYDPDPAPA